MQDKLRDTIQDFFDAKLRDTFPDPNFTFDVYVPPPHDKVWVVDFNPWAVRTDPLIFSWMELLTMEVPDAPSSQETTVRLKMAQPGDESVPIKASDDNTEEDQDTDADDDDIEEL